jgi:hypothetical protein
MKYRPQILGYILWWVDWKSAEFMETRAMRLYWESGQWKKQHELSEHRKLSYRVQSCNFDRIYTSVSTFPTGCEETVSQSLLLVFEESLGNMR